MREAVIARVLEKKIIAIVRGVYGDDCLRLSHALYNGGIELLEVTYDPQKPGRARQTSDTIMALIEDFGDKMLFGAGTVTTTKMVDLSYEAGAEFIISPNTDREIIQKTRALGLVSIPGAMTPTEILNAHNYGADFVKIFPASILGDNYIRAIRSPINHVPLLVVGGVNETNILEFLSAGAAGVGVGGNLVNKELIRNGQFDKITELARRYVESAAEGENR